jgi:hypothetical protein
MVPACRAVARAVRTVLTLRHASGRRALRPRRSRFARTSASRARRLTIQSARANSECGSPRPFDGIPGRPALKRHARRYRLVVGGELSLQVSAQSRPLGATSRRVVPATTPEDRCSHRKHTRPSRALTTLLRPAGGRSVIESVEQARAQGQGMQFRLARRPARGGALSCRSLLIDGVVTRSVVDSAVLSTRAATGCRLRLAAAARQQGRSWSRRAALNAYHVPPCLGSQGAPRRV